MPPRIAIGTCRRSETAGMFTDSLAGSLFYDREYGHDQIIGTIGLQTSPRMPEARSQVIEAFFREKALQHPETKLAPEWLMMIDSDMTWEPDAIHTLVNVAEAEDIGVIGGLCFAGHIRKMFPTIYRYVDGPQGNPVPEPCHDYPRDSLVKVAATGAAFLAVHRDVLIKMHEAFKQDAEGNPHPYPWFIDHVYKGASYGEDMMFCKRAQAIGYDCYVHTGVKVGHVKDVVLSEQLYDDMRRLDA